MPYQPASHPESGDDVPYDSSGPDDDLRTESLLALVLELYRAAHETPPEEFPGLAFAMLSAIAPIDPDEVMRAAQGCDSGMSGASAAARGDPDGRGSRSDCAALAEHLANAIRLNRALHPQWQAALRHSSAGS